MAPQMQKYRKSGDKEFKTFTDVWWHSVIGTNAKERLGYPTQKPLELLEWILAVHTNPNDTVLDFFAGAGTTGEAALKLGRNAILVDNNPDAEEVMRKRFPDAVFLDKGTACK